MQNRITKLKPCQECGAATDGKSCRCGWVRRGLKKTNQNYPRCRMCNAIGDHGGLCEMHDEQQAWESYKKRIESYREPGKNDYEIDVLTGKIIPELQPKQEENENE